MGIFVVKDSCKMISLKVLEIFPNGTLLQKANTVSSDPACASFPNRPHCLRAFKLCAWCSSVR